MSIQIEVSHETRVQMKGKRFSVHVIHINLEGVNRWTLNAYLHSDHPAYPLLSNDDAVNWISSPIVKGFGVSIPANMVRRIDSYTVWDDGDSRVRDLAMQTRFTFTEPQFAGSSFDQRDVEGSGAWQVFEQAKALFTELELQLMYSHRG